VDERGIKSSWEGEQLIVTQEMEGKQKGKNRDKKIVMVKLVIQEKTNTHTKPKTKKHQVQGHQKIQFFGKSSQVIPQVSNTGIGIQAGAQMWLTGFLVFGSFCPQG
jgi:hypothetical protein